MPAIERPAVRLDVFGRRRRTPRYPVLGFRRQAEMFALLTFEIHFLTLLLKERFV